MKKWKLKGAAPAKCGCYFPEITRVGDDTYGRRLFYCINHGFSLVKRPKPDVEKAELVKLPTDVWVNARKNEIREIIKKNPRIGKE